MKISFVEPHLELYGGIRRILELANRLTERGHDVTIFHSDGSDCKWMKCIAKIKSYREVLDEEHDVIICNDTHAVDYNLVRKARARLKVYYVLALYERALLKGVNPRICLPWYKRDLILKKYLRTPYLKLSNSTWVYHWLRENMDIDSKLLIGGINTGVFHPIEVKRNPDEIRILCSGDPRERKGTDTIFKAVEIAKRQEPRIVLDTYYGKGIPQEKMAEKYSSADIFVDGQWYAGWNNPVAEAMACKVPVVCTNIGGVQDFAFHEKTALLVPSKDPEAMASAILRLIREEKLRETLRENAYHHIRQFNWDESARRLEEVLGSELSKPNPSYTSLKYDTLHLIPDAVSRALNIGYSAASAILKSIRSKGETSETLLPSTNFNPSYIGSRNDILSLIPNNVGKVLDIGCSVGTLGEQIKRRNNNVEVIGIEMDEQMAKVAKEKLDSVIIEDAENINLADYFSPNYFDCVIFADILEHLKNPWDVLKNATSFLNNEGVIIASIPNVRYHTTIANLVFKGYWPYRERGIHDKTHLRFFTLKNIRELFQQANLKIVSIKRNYRVIEKPHPLNKYARYFALPPFKDFLTFQYLVVAEKKVK